MLILLPPSEGKNTVHKGKPVSLTSLSFGKELNPTRKKTLAALGLALVKAPSAKAIDVYSGVLYQALDYHNLNSAAQKRAQKSIIIISALFGALKLTDSIPTYKLDMAKSLPKLGSLNALWKPIVTKALENIKTDLIVDCRSSTYQGVWTPDLKKTVAIRVFAEKAGKRTVVTHMSKKTRGDVTKFLVMQTKNPKTAQELQKLVAKAFKCELVKPEGKKSWLLDVIVKS
ncbi:MAG: peroxide stress protein YaaA [Candidatus Nanopelagicales bacterium]|nr:peroxide stress protein YaaA [Candidatus Nanopelagicales bacterium]